MYILIKIIVQFFESKIPERVLLTGAKEQKFHTECEGRMYGLSLLQFLCFESLHYDI